MKGLGTFVVGIAPFALLIAPILYAMDSPTPGMSLVGGFFLGIGLSALYYQVQRIANALNKEK